MTPRRLLLVALALLAAGWGLWRLATAVPAADPEVPLPDGGDAALLSGDPGALRRLTVEHHRLGKRIRVVREDGRWRMTDPLEDAVEPMVLSGILDALYSDDWRAAPEEWRRQSDEDLGLDPARVAVEALYAGGDRVILRLGAPDLAGDWHAAEREGERVRVAKAVVKRISRPAQQWRDHRLQPFGAAVQRVRWTPRAGTPLEFASRRRDWTLVEPVEGPLDALAEQFLMRMLGARASGIGDASMAVPDGVTPQGVLLIEAEDGRRVTLSFLESALVSSVRDYPLGYQPRDFAVLHKPVEELLSDRVLQMDPDQIVSIQVEYGGEEALFRRGPEGWMRRGQREVMPTEVQVTLNALIGHASTLEIGEALPVPERAPRGRILYSISRTPAERGSAVLLWWLDEQGRNVVAAQGAERAARSAVNFEEGIRDLFARL